MELINTETIIVKKSKFISYAYKIDTFEEIKQLILEKRSEHKKAKHVVYAYTFGNSAGKTDDKEPKGTAGLQLYNILKMERLENTLIIVVRYFGGTLLGSGLLAHTYKEAALKAIKN